MSTFTAPDGRVGLIVSTTATHVCLRFADGTAQWFTRDELGASLPPAPVATQPPGLATRAARVVAAGFLGMLVVVIAVASCEGPQPYVDPHAERWDEVYRGVQATCRQNGLSVSECGELEARARRMVRDGEL